VRSFSGGTSVVSRAPSGCLAIADSCLSSGSGGGAFWALLEEIAPPQPCAPAAAPAAPAAAAAATPAPASAPPPKPDVAAACRACGAGEGACGCGWVLPRRGGLEVLADYEFGQTLGRGTFGVTRLVTERATARACACKTVCKQRLLGHRQFVEDVRSEVAILEHLAGVRGVVQLRGAYEDRRAVNLVLELCAGGDLLDHILRRGRLPERDAAAAARAMLLALRRCHERGVAHRDVKPENFLLARAGDAASVRISDFGASAFIKPGQQFAEIVGTPYYMAPEVLLRCYDQVRRAAPRGAWGRRGRGTSRRPVHSAAAL
jgi:calcium-dependent protein kinase